MSRDKKCCLSNGSSRGAQWQGGCQARSNGGGCRGLIRDLRLGSPGRDGTVQLSTIQVPVSGLQVIQKVWFSSRGKERGDGLLQNLYLALGIACRHLYRSPVSVRRPPPAVA